MKRAYLRSGLFFLLQMFTSCMAVHGDDVAASSPKAQTERLLTEGAPLAQELLGKHREFYPFAMTMTRSGEIKLASSYPSEHPESAEVAGFLLAGLRRDSQKYAAVAIFTDMRVSRTGSKTDMVDTIRVSLEHRSG